MYTIKIQCIFEPGNSDPYPPSRGRGHPRASSNASVTRGARNDDFGRAPTRCLRRKCLLLSLFRAPVETHELSDISYCPIKTNRHAAFDTRQLPAKEGMDEEKLNSLLALSCHLCLKFRPLGELAVSLPSISALVKVLLLYRVEDGAQLSCQRKPVSHDPDEDEARKTYRASRRPRP